NFNYANGVDQEDRVVFISLANWSFSCPDEKEFELNSRSLASLVAKGLSAIKVKTSPDVTVEEYLKSKLTKDTLYRGVDQFTSLLPDIYGAASIVTKADRQK